MKPLFIASLLATAFATTFTATTPAFAAASIGQPAPAFTVTDTSDTALPLEWVNPGCPYVQKHYNAANMQATQKEAAAKGVVWLAINSTAIDAGDYLKPAEMAAWMAKQNAAASATLMDTDGKVGRAYGARTTPHMYVVDPAGKLVYAGGIDSKPSSNPADIATATNYVKAALGEALAGKVISQANTRPYGCSIKYSSGA